MRSDLHFLPTACALLVLLPGGLFAQAVSGTILGSVQDASGAAIPGASVTLVNADTGLTRTVATNASGDYDAPSLPPGIYNVSAEMKGFKKVSLAGIRLNVDQKARVDLKLEVGDLTESIQVQAAVPLVQSDSSELGATVNESQIKELPLNGRDFVQLTRLIPGVTRGVPGSNNDGASNEGWRMSSTIAANGMRTRDNNFLLDGIDNNELNLNTVIIFPSVDAIEEFKVQTSTYSAEFGRANGGVVNIQIKSGTNQFHGSGFEFLRNDKLDANDLFNNKFGRVKPSFRQNQFGGTLGGPIRHDRTFFFMDYQGWRVRNAQTYLSSVPSNLMRSGDFSELNRAIYDPLSQTPFAGNRIPASRLDPVAQNIIGQLYPTSNVPGQRTATGQTINNFLYNPVLRRQDDQFDVKVNQRISDNNQFFARYSFERSEQFLPASLPHGDAGATTGNGNGLIRTQSLALNDTHTFNARWLNEFRFGLNRWGLVFSPIDFGTNLADKVGLPGVNISDTTSAMAQVVFSPADVRGLGSGGNAPELNYFTTFQWLDNVTYTRGRNSLKFGANVIRRRKNKINPDNSVGNFSFGSPLTSNCGGIPSGCTINPNTGFSVASFMLGYPSSVSRALLLGIAGERKWEYGAYVQDDYRVTKRLTLNLGLRYEFFSPPVEVADRQSNFDPVSGRFVGASPSAVIAGNKVGRPLMYPYTRDWAPRVGLAYDMFGTGRTVLRAGYGISWDNPFTGGSGSKTKNPPFLLSTALTTTLLPTLRLDNGLPPPPPISFDQPPQGSARSLFDLHDADGYAQQWNVNIQHQLGRDFMLETAYVGTHGTHLMMKQDINQAPATLGVTNTDINRPYITISPLLRGLSEVQSRGWSVYHSLQVKVTKRFARDFMMLSSYTFGKVLDISSDAESGTLNAWNFNQDRGPANFDIKHSWTTSGIYELPFGKGRRLLSGLGGAANSLVSGWQIDAIVTVQSGLPFTVGQQQGLLSTGTGNRPNRIASGTLANPTPDHWFDLTAFRPTADNTGTWGNSGRGILRAPGLAQADLSVVKNTRFKERFEHQFKVEMFNALNHPQFASPGATIGTASAGVISSLLYNTPMRQIQMAMKLSF
ncbi:MAG TPA: carboxypeptidase regulatory-like domain-containing protein [Bryobacteraceae bacterium]|nr:carboxypeptidase regulatory-like domain-containing protein [Bryobacteraceae bacterium]